MMPNVSLYYATAPILGFGELQGTGEHALVGGREDNVAASRPATASRNHRHYTQEPRQQCAPDSIVDVADEGCGLSS